MRMRDVVQQLRQPTLTSREVAPLFREPFILSGYRLVHQPWSYYWKSIFWIHNETVNVWTHLIASILTLMNACQLLQTYDITNTKYGSSILGFSLGCFLATFLSTVAHQFHSKSLWWHYVLFFTDYAGVNLYIFGTGIGCMYICSQKDVYHYLSHVYLPLNVFFSWFTFYVSCKAKLSVTECSRGRRLVTMISALVIYALLISIPVFARYTNCLLTPGCSLHSLNHLTKCFALIALSAVLFACHAPERFLPGKFDIVGHGHSLFHFVHIFTLDSQIEGIRTDISSGMAAHTEPCLLQILSAYAFLMSAQIVTIFYLREDINRRVEVNTREWQKIQEKMR